MHDLSHTLKLAIVWLLIGTAVFVGVLWWNREQARPRISLADGTLVLERGRDGHYHWPGRVEGRDVLFLVDTGATRTALPGSLARALDVPRGQVVRTQTAAGPVTGYEGRVRVELQGGLVAERLPVTVLDAMEGPPLLGMDVLGRLHIEYSGGRMRISPPRDER